MEKESTKIDFAEMQGNFYSLTMIRRLLPFLATGGGDLEGLRLLDLEADEREPDREREPDFERLLKATILLIAITETTS